MKVIDLLNKIANNEEVPKKIKTRNNIYEYEESENDYLHDKYKLHFINNELIYAKRLNDEIEIIEEKPKKIEELDFVRIDDYTISGLVKSLNELIIEYNEKINEIIKTQNDLIERIDFDEISNH